MMEKKSLKSAWQHADTTSRNEKDIRSMVREGSHPVLKRIRKQFLIETIAFAIFLALYYNFFDGDRKPFYANALLVAAMLFVMVHNIIAYIFTKARYKGNNIKQALEAHLYRMKVHAVLSVANRVLMTVCLLFFFTATITFTTNKYWILAALILTFIIMMILLWRVWMKRIINLKRTTEEFSS